jgi:hypothetical protein
LREAFRLEADDLKQQLTAFVLVRVGLDNALPAVAVWLEGRKPKPLADVISAPDGIIAGKAVHDEAVRCVLVQLHREASILLAMSRPWRQYLIARRHFAAKKTGDFSQLHVSNFFGIKRTMRRRRPPHGAWLSFSTGYYSTPPLR